MRARRVSGAVLTGVATIVAGVTIVWAPPPAAASQAATVTLSPKASHTPNPRAARALLRKRLTAMGIDGTVERRGADLVMTLPHGTGKWTPEEIVPGEVRMRPVLAELSRVAGPDGTTTSPEAVRACDVAAVTDATYAEPTTADGDLTDACIVADSPESKETPLTRFLLGPAALVGSDLKSAKAQFSPGNGFVVLMNLTKAGQRKFNALAAKLYSQQSPRNQVAILLDQTVESNPAFQAASFSGPVQISGGGDGFSKVNAEDLAKVVNFGASALGAYEITKVTTG